jgi:hypothetical protein
MNLFIIKRYVDPDMLHLNLYLSKNITTIWNIEAHGLIAVLGLRRRIKASIKNCDGILQTRHVFLAALTASATLST